MDDERFLDAICGHLPSIGLKVAALLTGLMVLIGVTR